MPQGITFFITSSILDVNDTSNFFNPSTCSCAIFSNFLIFKFSSILSVVALYAFNISLAVSCASELNENCDLASAITLPFISKIACAIFSNPLIFKFSSVLSVVALYAFNISLAISCDLARTIILSFISEIACGVLLLLLMNMLCASKVVSKIPFISAICFMIIVILSKKILFSVLL